jgi:hypothetical protein
MAWLVGDGFDFYTSASSDFALGGLGDSQYVSASGGTTATTRFGTGQAFNAAAGGQGWTTVTFANSTTIWANFAIYNTAATYVAGGTTVLQGFCLRDGAFNQVGVYVRSGGDFIVTNGQGNGTILATSPQLFLNAGANGVWHHVQCKIVINNTTGSVELRIDGHTTDDYSVSSINTRNGSTNSYVNNGQFGFVPAGTSSQMYWDDWYMFNDQGAAPNNWQGDVRAYSYYPNADSGLSWTPNSGANNFSRVAQAYDADTTYVSTSGIGNFDKYTLPALPTTPNSIINVQTRLVARYDDTGPHTVSSRLWSGATPSDSVSGSLTATYQQIWKNYLTDPNTGSAWATSTLSSLFVGPVDVL